MTCQGTSYCGARATFKDNDWVGWYQVRKIRVKDGAEDYGQVIIEVKRLGQSDTPDVAAHHSCPRKEHFKQVLSRFTKDEISVDDFVKFEEPKPAAASAGGAQFWKFSVGQWVMDTETFESVQIMEYRATQEYLVKTLGGETRVMMDKQLDALPDPTPVPKVENDEPF
jgi:hypothetical protein